MEMITVIAIAFGLAMDAFVVSLTSGIAIRHLRIKHALKIAIFFGSFQAIMPLIGWLAGLSLRDFISGVDHWISFGLLSLIGCRMIYESIRPSEREINPLSIHVLLMLSVATSIDALAVGVSLAFLRIAIVPPIVVIGTVTFLLSFLGVFAGNRFGHLFGNKVEIVGGLILIAIGTKILVEHLV